MTFVTPDFEIPSSADLDNGQLRLLTMADVATDHEVFMSSRPDLAGFYDPNDLPWPKSPHTFLLSLARLGFCEWECVNRNSFCYGIFDSGTAYQLGRLHIEPSSNPSFDAQIVFWMRRNGGEREARLLNQVNGWLASSWPFKAVAMPGRSERWGSFSRSLLVPGDFEVPERVVADDFLVRFMTTDDYVEDYAAYMSSGPEVRSTWDPDFTEWPEVEVSLHEAMVALGAVDWEHFQRLLFSYCVMTPDDKRQIGCIYVAPAGMGGFDAEVTYWVRKEEYEAGFHNSLSAWLENWVGEAWPFEKPAFPGGSMSWEDWNNMSE